MRTEECCGLHIATMKEKIIADDKRDVEVCSGLT